MVHTHANLASSLRALRDCWRITPDDVTVNVLPLFHIHGLSFATHLSLLSGGCMVMEDAFHPRRTLEVVGRGTVFMAIPTFYYAFLDRPEFPEAARLWRRRPAVHLRLRADPAGGPAEAGGDPGPAGDQPLRHDGGARDHQPAAGRPLAAGLGRPCPWTGSRCASPGTTAPRRRPDEVGAVLVRGPNLFRDYWRNPEATRAAFALGWFDTGDLGRLDPAGFLTLVGRKDDLIITNGFNVYPQVVERVINACPGVRESAVLGLPDDRRGERVAAVVVRDDPALDERRLRAHCGERLVDYQRPLDGRLRGRPAAQRHGQGAAPGAA